MSLSSVEITLRCTTLLFINNTWLHVCGCDNRRVPGHNAMENSSSENSSDPPEGNEDGDVTTEHKEGQKI